MITPEMRIIKALIKIADELEKIRKLKQIEMTVIHLEDRIAAIESEVNNNS